MSNVIEKIEKKKRVKALVLPLQPYYNEDPAIYEIGVDEVGRGPLFGRVYTAAVILPKDDSFDHSKMKDSKKFSCKQKIQEVAQYIKEHAIAWSICYEDEKVIDEINILQATQRSMHQCIGEILKKVNNANNNNSDSNYDSIQLLIDGNYFNSYTTYNASQNKWNTVKHVCVEKGDNTYS
jgi:ribonuclease HII